MMGKFTERFFKSPADSFFIFGTRGTGKSTKCPSNKNFEQPFQSISSSLYLNLFLNKFFTPDSNALRPPIVFTSTISLHCTAAHPGCLLR